MYHLRTCVLDFVSNIWLVTTHAFCEDYFMCVALLLFECSAGIMTNFNRNFKYILKYVLQRYKMYFILYSHQFTKT